MRIHANRTPTRRRSPRPSSTSARSGNARSPRTGRLESLDLPLPELGEDAVLTIVRPTAGGTNSLRTLMSGTSWTRNAAYVSARNGGRTIPAEASTALVAAHVDEVLTTRVKGWAEAMRIELRTSTGHWSTLVDRVRQLDDGGWQLSELKAEWSGFATDRARVQARLGALAADALGAEYVREVPATLGSPMLRRNCSFIQTYRFVPFSLRAQYVAADMLERLGTVSLGRLADALTPNAANGMALVCSLMVQRLVAIDLETKVGRDSEVRPVPPLPNHMPGLYDALVAKIPPLSDAA